MGPCQTFKNEVLGLPCGLVVKNPPASAEGVGSIPSMLWSS